MGVYIKGMEMPKSCRECPFETYYFNCGETRCRATLKTLATDFQTITFDGRADNCPLIELPPHGRLIDADAFCEKVLEIVERQKYDDFYAKSLSVGAILREVVRELRGEGFDGFDNAPTIIPADGGET